jgi:hypothetical protein
VLRSLGILYGDIRSIMIRMTFAHQNLGKIPSHGAARERLIHLVNEHSRIIKGVKDLETEVMKEKTWGNRTSAPWAITNNWYYLYNLGKMLPDQEQCNLCICEGHHPISFSTLRGAFRELMDTLTKEDHHSKPEADQIQMESTRDSEEEEHKEKKACILCNSPTESW